MGECRDSVLVLCARQEELATNRVDVAATQAIMMVLELVLYFRMKVGQNEARIESHEQSGNESLILLYFFFSYACSCRAEADKFCCRELTLVPTEGFCGARQIQVAGLAVTALRIDQRPPRTTTIQAYQVHDPHDRPYQVSGIQYPPFPQEKISRIFCEHNTCCDIRGTRTRYPRNNDTQTEH